VKTILIVEDEPLVFLDLQYVVHHAGHETAGPAFSVERAEALIAEAPIDAALLDVNLGDGETTAAVAERLRDQGVPYAFVTAYDEHVIPEHLANVPLVRKPYLEWEVLRAVDQLLQS
jgi:DNA-binding LytR/AlgR family response regulator